MPVNRSLRTNNPRRTIRRRVFALAFVMALGAGCSGAAPAANVDAELSGTITISGSSTVEPISIGVAEKFNAQAPNVDISVDGPGTGDGFELFCKGEIDISDASRPISEAEIAACEQAGISFIEMKIGIDGIAVLTSPENDEVNECLSFNDIYALAGPESQGFQRWSDASQLATQLGDSKATPFPDLALSITGPGEESGTYDSFVEIVLEDIAEARGRDAQTRPDYQSSGDDNVIVQGIEGAPGSFGWVGFSFFEANQQNLKAFSVAGESGECVEPTPETIADGSYPISRPLFIYANAQKLESNEALQQFLEFYLSEEGIASVTDVGYVALPGEELDANRQALESRTTGKREA